MITPSDSPSAPAQYDAVTPHGQGTAPYDVQAGNDLDAITSAMDGANALAGSGVLYPQGPRQMQTEALLESPQGFGIDGYDIDAGYSGGGGEDWPNNVEPGG